MVAAGRIRYEVEGAVATVTIDHPLKRNALTFAMRDALVDQIIAAGADDAVRVVVLTGEGDTFTTGVDIDDRPDQQDPAGRTLEADEAEIADAAGRWLSLWELPKPVIVKARGYCIGWGLEMALHADVVVATPDCRFFYPSVLNGSGLPDSSITVHHVSPQWAKRLLLAGETIDGTQAERIGLVSEVVADADLDDAVAALARSMAARPASLLAAAKAVVNKGVELQGRAALQATAERANAVARQDPEAEEFGRILREQGRTAAIAWRDRPTKE